MPAPGDRVVVRRLLPSGQATDVIGTLLSDGDPLVVRADRDGAEHVIPRTGIVRWKTVPERPVRASEIRSLDLARARSWWSVEREWIDGWLCRAAVGLPGHRANAAAPLHPDASLDRLGGVRAWYAARGLPMRLTVSDRALPGAAGLAPVVQPTEVLTAPAVADGADPEIRFASAPDAAWLALTGTAEPLVASVDGAAFFASIAGPDGVPVAAGRLALTADAAGTVWGGVGSMAVAPDHRRQGLATRLLGAARARAADEGATRVFLEVTLENTGARELYRRAGFTHHHGYHYWAEQR
ncbi:GNAT family N-acetyltransferase [Tsukamurella ocularis]|uniref:GNAT family N-acetyltransferase n=1 Tax=Tsukamurella ocularis TaxID=1970234 RepID=UPI0021688668|nr:GNAT family N-acetyltransferase [Tsukamurella ocularis]MCS3778790.1 GNAT superfamily N-acetyltransferase [Tsukamurella ocularis]MCS3787590.1 GNAT superfamily N-acetyltransferase [Tsukamurella ocularis]MCS3851473.1 GNAT superfamily N-acetyltransferase [Tsukamurella ocularis]